MLEIKTAILPDNIIWQNMGVSKFSMLIRQIIQFILGLIILGGAVALSLYLFATQQYFDDQMLIINSCPESITKKVAINDLRSGDTGLMHCYCYNRII